MSRPPNGYPRNTSGQTPPPSAAMSRAERFEDEKRRIIESCFSKTDANGQLVESYITHIRIMEDASYPSSPPPPESGADNKKPRLIIIAVRSTGRVRMHKARENNNGSFSIGKTWNLEELSAIETFSGIGVPLAQDDKEQKYREWAGNVGFTVTITKPYYWQAGTAKEKDFFIASCVKIYRKYTKGLVPELKGFGDQERGMMLGQQTGGQRQTSGASYSTESLPPPNAPFARPGATSRDGPASRDGSRYRNESPGAPPSIGEMQRLSGSPARAPRGPPSGGFGQPPAAPRSFGSQEQMRASQQSYASREGTPSALRPGPRPPPPSGTPPNVQGKGLSAQSSQSHLSSASPDLSSAASSLPTTGPPVVPVIQPQGSSQARGYERQPSMPELQQQQQPPPTGLNGNVSSPVAAGAFHASMFNQSKQERYGQSQQQSTPPPAQKQQIWAPQQPQWQQATSGGGAPQLPPIQTDQPGTSLLNDTQTPKPDTANQSEASSAAIDLNDAAAIGALTGFWGPELSTSTPPFAPKIQEPFSPPTPERSSRRRPQMDERQASTDSYDLRPPPLGSARSRTPNDDPSRYNTPQDRSAIPSPGQPSSALPSPGIASAQRTPKQEQFPFNSDAPKPLFQREVKTDSVSNLPLPGAIATPPIGTSPAKTPDEESVRSLTPQAVPTPVKVGETMDDVKPAEAENETETEQPVSQSAIPGEQFRPGLGPMIRKGKAADRIRTAARAANAFKPRPGGAAEKIMKAKAEREATGEADGISGVFKPKPKVEEESPLVVRPLERQGTDLSVKSPVSAQDENTPRVEVHSPVSPIKNQEALSALDGNGNREGVQLTDGPLQPDGSPQPDLRDVEDDKLEQRALKTPQGKIKRRSFRQERHITELGIDRSLLDGKGLDFEALLSNFGWLSDNEPSALVTSTATLTKPKLLPDLEADIKREASRVEAGTWLSHTDTQRDEKIGQVDSLLERCIAECDELEGLLTLYSVELGSLNEDIAFIEAQSQGLQVQSANQKLLHTELQGLVDTMSLDQRVLEPLRYGDLSDERGLENVELSLVRLYNAMLTMDPTLKAGNSVEGKARKSGISEGENELAQMKALQEKKSVYERETTVFSQRLMQHLDYTFTTSLNGAKDRVLRPVSGGGASSTALGLKKLDRAAFAGMRAGLWVYSPLILFTKELNPPAWTTLLRLYYQRARPLYENAFKENTSGWKRSVRKPVGDEADILFTAQDKEGADSVGSGGLSSTARKLTVKRSQTLAKTLRQASGGDKNAHSDGGVRNPGAMMASEVFSGAMDEMAPLVSQEQNFIVDLFHATSLETADFIDVVAATPPEERRGTNLLAGRHVEPDRELARWVTNTMEEIFGFFTAEISSLLDWAVSTDPVQGVGIMANLSRHAWYLQAQNASQEWLLSMIDTLSSHLQTLFSRFVEEQVRAIEDTKVKIKKRKGVIAFMKIFPHFSGAVENVFFAIAGPDYEHGAECVADVRRLVDDAYTRLNRAMFDSLKVIAKESPGAQPQPQQHSTKTGQSDDPEDKEALNYQILIIENMNHYLEEVDDSARSTVLAEWRDRAQRERKEALDAYVSRVIRRPLGKLLDYLDGADAFSRSADTPLSSRQNYSRKAARNMLSQYDGREVRKGIDALRKRIDKHFGDADEESISRGLVGLVCKECEMAYESTLARLERLREEYPTVEGERSVEIAFGKADVQAGFSK